MSSCYNVRETQGYGWRPIQPQTPQTSWLKCLARSRLGLGSKNHLAVPPARPARRFDRRVETADAKRPCRTPSAAVVRTPRAPEGTLRAPLAPDGPDERRGSSRLIPGLDRPPCCSAPNPHWDTWRGRSSLECSVDPTNQGFSSLNGSWKTSHVTVVAICQIEILFSLERKWLDNA